MGIEDIKLVPDSTIIVINSDATLYGGLGVNVDCHGTVHDRYSGVSSVESATVSIYAPSDNQKACHQQVCKLPGCNRPRYVEPGGRAYECCGRTHARLYKRQNGNGMNKFINCNTILFILCAWQLHRFLSISSVPHQAA